MSNIEQFQHHYLLLFESCRLTKGHTRTLLYDSQRKNLLFIDNELYPYLSKTSRQQTVGEYISYQEPSQKEIIIEYLEEVIDKEYGFFCTKEEIDFFPRINLQWEDPAVITNCIIDFDQPLNNLSDYSSLIKDLELLGCENMQVRCFQSPPLELIIELGKLVSGTIITRLSLLIKASKDVDLIIEQIENIPSINELIIHGSDTNETITNSIGQKIILSTQQVNDHSHCGLISSKLFNLEWEHYLESQSYNTCLNRKVGISPMGEIKNCPSMLTSFGNIKTDRLTEVVKKEAFKKMWTLKKDEIEGCKICEFRHICTDCRAFQADGDYSKLKPKKCTYDPLVGEWESTFDLRH